MEKPSPHTGWLWIKEGFALFRKQPTGICTLFLSYLFLMFAVGIIPLVGQIAPVVLIPVFAMSFMQACVDMERDKKIHPNLLLIGFRSPAFKRLLVLGALYFATALIAFGVSVLIDGGMLWQIMSGQNTPDPETVRQSNISLALIAAALIYTPAAMAFWYAAPLIAWQDMPVSKAIFYSFFTVKHSSKAFLVYGIAWALIGIFLPAAVSVLIGLILSSPTIAMVALLPLSLIMTVVMYCSFYPTYTYVFGPPPRQQEQRQEIE